jgi:hypothetical protein
MTWADLFDRATPHETSVTEIRERLDARGEADDE